MKNSTVNSENCTCVVHSTGLAINKHQLKTFSLQSISSTVGNCLIYFCLLVVGGVAAAWPLAGSPATSTGCGVGGIMSVTKMWRSLSTCRRPSDLSWDSISNRRLSLPTRSARHGAPTLINRAWHPTAYHHIKDQYTCRLQTAPTKLHLNK